MARGVNWLVETQRADGSWDEPQYTGTGFPSDYYINYHLYRLTFPVMALGRCLRAGGAPELAGEAAARGVRPTVAEPLALPGADAVMARAAGENFPVASRLLPRSEREHLLAIYGFARLVDELGDSLPGDREQALEWLEHELALAFAGHATHPLLVRLQGTLRACRLAPSRSPG